MNASVIDQSHEIKKQKAIAMLASQGPRSSGEAMMILHENSVKGRGDFLHEVIADYFQEIPHVQSNRESMMRKGMLILIQEKPMSDRGALRILKENDMILAEGDHAPGRLGRFGFNELTTDYFTKTIKRELLEQELSEDTKFQKYDNPSMVAKKMFELINSDKAIKGFWNDNDNSIGLTPVIKEALDICVDNKVTNRRQALIALVLGAANITTQETNKILKSYDYAANIINGNEVEKETGWKSLVKNFMDTPSHSDMTLSAS